MPETIVGPIELPIRVCLVERNATLRDLLSNVLRDAGFELAAAADSVCTGTQAIAAHLPHVAVIHMTCHTLARLLQFLRAPSLFHDIHLETDAMGGHGGPTGRHLEAIFPEKIQRVLYRFALERGYLDPLLDHWVAEPVMRAASRLDGWEKRWTDFLGGGRKGKEP